jgi:hypothetical protein
MLDCDPYRSLRLVRHDDEVLELVMICRPGQTLQAPAHVKEAVAALREKRAPRFDERDPF